MMNVEKQILTLIQEIYFIFLSMNAMGYVQSKCIPEGRRVSFARDHDPHQNKIHLLYLILCFCNAFVRYLWSFD